MSTSRSSRPSLGSLHPTRQQLDELDALLQRMLRLPGGPAEMEGLEGGVEQAKPLMRSVGRLPEEPIGLAPELIPLATHQPSSPAVQGPHLHRQKRDKQQQSDNAGNQGGEDWIPLRSSWQPSPHTWPPLAESWRQAHEADGQPEPSLRQDSPLVSRENWNEPLRVLASEPEIPTLPKVQEPIRYSGSNPIAPIAQQRVSPPPEPLKQAGPASSAPAQENISNGSPDDNRANLFAVRPLLWLNQGFDLLVGWAGPPGRWLVSPGGRTCLGYLGIFCLIGALALAVSDLLGWT